MDPGPLLSQQNNTISSSRSKPTTETVACEEIIPGSSPCALGTGNSGDLVHNGKARAMYLAARSNRWPTNKTDIKMYCEACIPCKMFADKPKSGSHLRTAPPPGFGHTMTACPCFVSACPWFVPVCPSFVPGHKGHNWSIAAHPAKKRHILFRKLTVYEGGSFLVLVQTIWEFNQDVQTFGF